MMTRAKVYPLYVLLLVAVASTGCKKNVSAAPPAAVIQPPLPPTPTIALRAMPTIVDRGQTVALQWESRDASNVRIEPELGTVQAQGSRLVNPSLSVTYTATATGPGGTASDVARITVRVPAANPTPSGNSRPTPNVNVESLFNQNVRAIYFDYDRSDIRPDQVPILDANAVWLKAHGDVKFTVQGHCDERGSAEYNLGLGDSRANRVKEHLIKKG